MVDSWQQVTKYIIQDAEVLYGSFLNQTERLVLESFVKNSRDYGDLRYQLSTYNGRLWNILYKYTFGNIEWMRQYEMINYL